MQEFKLSHMTKNSNLVTYSIKSSNKLVHVVISKKKKQWTFSFHYKYFLTKQNFLPFSKNLVLANGTQKYM